ncbi:unnamed protein product [Rotaria magnacalcarata]|uniref:FLYWCH-type domain-containing protein n=1 Tax=Rotaria magnacalcarata TaxID=392030 RepID=A0A815ZJ95_9BILA|nr:unnamed protein product [Rotaria magnacalcarata]CAF4921359.1 unnamed protein product [Rotaria magnacalcarata]
MVDSTLISFTTSNRGRLLLVYAGHIYRLKKSTEKVKYWACHIDDCLASVHTNKNDEFIKANGHHHHMPEPEKIELRNLKKRVKDRVQSETNSIPQIYEEELARSNLSSAALTLAPVALDTKSGLNRVRRKTTPPIPTSADFDIPDFYQQSLNAEQLICTDKITKKKRMILFATDKQLEVLFSSEWIFLDGTFDKCPKQFQQIYTIHALKFNESEFPSAMHHGCFFHYCQSLYKHIISLGLSAAYVDNEDLRLACRCTMALALLPEEHVEEAFELLKNDSPEEMSDFFEYFQKQWLKRVPKKYWNVSNLEFRKNNICETWDNKFNNRVEKHHPNVWHLFQCLQRQELSFRQKLGKANSGQQLGSSNRKCTIRTQVDILKERYEQEHIDLIEFLYGLSTLVAKNSK